MKLSQLIRENSALKGIIHRLLIPKGQARPRLWVKILLNPFFHKRGKSSIIARRARLDVLPFNDFALGNKSTIEDFATINNGVGEVKIGNNTLIGIGNVIIGPVKLGNNIILAQNIVISGLNHNYEDPQIPIRVQGVKTSPVIIEDDCWIGANSVITAGVHIGKHAVVAAGSVVTRNVPPYTIAAGNPARIIKKFNFINQKWEKRNEEAPQKTSTSSYY